MNLNYNDAEIKEESKYVTKKTFITTIIVLFLIIIIAIVSLMFYFDNKLQRTIESMELKDDLTLIQNGDDSWVNNVKVE